MRIISISTIISGLLTLFLSLLALFLSFFLLYACINNHTEMFVFWLGGFFLMGCFTALRTRSFLVILIVGIVAAALSALLLDGYILYTTIISHHQQAEVLGWLVVEGLVCLCATCAILFFAIPCCLLGGLLPALFRVIKAQLLKAQLL